MPADDIKKLKEFKIICYLGVYEIKKLFPELSQFKDVNWNDLPMAIMPTQHEIDRRKREIEEIREHLEFILQQVADSGCYIYGYLSLEKEFLLWPSDLSSLLHSLSGPKPKYSHDRVVAVFNGQIYEGKKDDFITEELLQKRFLSSVKVVASGLSEVLQCNTKLLFDEIAHSFIYEKKE